MVDHVAHRQKSILADDNFLSKEIEFTGVVNARFSRPPLPDSILINGEFFEVDGQTELRGFADEPILLANIRPGENIQIKALTRQNLPLLALRLKRRLLISGDVEVKGRIEQLQTNSLRVGGVDFLRATNTIVLDDENLFIPYTALRVGLTVEVAANRQTKGSLLAAIIKIADDDNDEVELTGLLNSRTDTSVTVTGFIFRVNTATVVLDENRLPTQFSGLLFGQLVEIHGDRRFDGSLLTTEIRLEDRLQQNELEWRGPITQITGNFVRVTDLDFTVSAATTILAMNGAIDSLGANSFLALRLLVKKTARTILRGLNNESISFSNLRVNEVVEILAEQLSDNSLLALRIKRATANARDLETRGKIMSRTATAITVAAVAFTIDAANQPIPPADLRSRQIAAVKGSRQINGVFVANQIQLQEQRELIGVVNEVATGIVKLNNLSQAVRPPSFFLWEIILLQILFRIPPTTAVAESPSSRPKEFALSQNFPNPFLNNGSNTAIRFTVPEAGEIALTIYNALGQKIRASPAAVCSPAVMSGFGMAATTPASQSRQEFIFTACKPGAVSSSASCC